MLFYDVNLMLFIYCKDFQLHVPPPPPPPYVMCLMLRAPTHLKHGTPISLWLLLSVSQGVQLFWGEAVMILLVFI